VSGFILGRNRSIASDNCLTQTRTIPLNAKEKERKTRWQHFCQVVFD